MEGIFRWDVVIEVMSICASAIGAYVAIRSDLKVLMVEHAGIAKRLDKLEDKFDAHLEGAHLHRRSTDSTM